MVGFFDAMFNLIKEHSLAVAVILFTTVILPIVNKYIDVEIFLPSEKREAHRWLRRLIENKRDNLTKETQLFGVKTEKNVFIKSMLVKNSQHKRIRFGRIRKSTGVITGDAGTGKSSLLKASFLWNSKKYKSRLKHKKVSLYFSSEDVLEWINDDVVFSRLLDNLTKREINKLKLYIDGVDEIGENNYANICAKLKAISAIVRIETLLVTCRTEYYDKYAYSDNGRLFGQEKYVVEKWTKDNITHFAEIIINNLKIDNKVKNKLVQSITNRSDLYDTINSPLLMKLYIYVLVNDCEDSLIFNGNKFTFYSTFLCCIVTSSYKNSTKVKSKSQINKELDTIALKVFESFSKGQKTIVDLIDNKITESPISPILKNIGSNAKAFTHETFFEYFIARCYCNQLKGRVSYRIIQVLKINYSNDYADFITAALLEGIESNNGAMQKTYAKRLRQIYYMTLSLNAQKEYWVYQDYSLAFLKDYINALSEREFFCLKYEIVFRLGRFDVDDDESIAFLKWVYDKDDNTKFGAKYYAIVLKRCCAISCSFMNAEKIELEYVRHMLSFDELYIADYDIANRSHTLLFYGDVTENSIFDFIDDNPEIRYDRAFKKRIERLSYQFAEKSIDKMTRKERRKYLFRLFDLATIYTFVNNRKIPLTNEQKEIVEKCTIVFEGASQERQKLMQRIKTEILNLSETF